MLIPSMLLKKLYTLGSLKNTERGVQFAVKKTGSVIPSAHCLEKHRHRRQAGGAVRGDASTHQRASAAARSDHGGYPAGLSFTHDRDDADCRLPALPVGMHEIEIVFEAKPFRKLQFKVEDALCGRAMQGLRIPRDANDDYSEAIIKQRQALVEQVTGTKSDYCWQYSFDPHVAKGNIENFTGGGSNPDRLCGPLRINGEHAQGDSSCRWRPPKAPSSHRTAGA